MMKLQTPAALLAILLAAGAATSANATTVQRGSSGASGVVRKAESGVNVYRGAKPVDLDLAGGDRANVPATAESHVVIVECRRGPHRYLRTHGFYSGHPGESRRFTQGFWSGPVDLTRSSVKVIRVVRR